MINKIYAFLLAISFCSASAMETAQTNEIAKLNESIKKEKSSIVKIITEDEATLEVPREQLKMSATLNSMLEDFSTIIDSDDIIVLQNIKSNCFELIQSLVKLLDQREKYQLEKRVDKKENIKREYGLYVLKTAYDIIRPSIEPLSCSTLIKILDAAYYLNIVGSTENQPILTEIIARQLVANFIIENNISLDDLSFPINFSSLPVTEEFGQLFNLLVPDLHPLIEEYIILQKIGADGKFDIADYVTLFDLNQDLFLVSYLGEIKLNNKKITSLNGIELVNNIFPTDTILKNIKIQKLDLSDNFLTNIQENSFKSFPDLEIINLANNKLYTIDPQIFAHLQLKMLKLDNNRLTTIADLSVDHLPLVYLALNKNNIKIINKKNISKTLECIELNYQQIKNNIVLLNELCPNADILLCTRDKHPEGQMFMKAMKFVEKNKITFTVNDWHTVLYGTILLEKAKNKVTSFKDNYCSIL